jgi:hypothetical protein
MDTKENTLEKLIDDEKYEFRTEKASFSFGELANMYEKREFIIRPEYQRYFRWNIEKKSKFIESILVGIPYPNAFINQRSEGVYELIDGLQRISTVLSFMGVLELPESDRLSIEEDIDDEMTIENKKEDLKSWKLKGCSIITDLDDKGFEELPLPLQLRLKRASMWFEVLSSKSPDLKYKLFDRLNTGGASLTPQEVRNAIFRGEVSSDKFFKVLELASSNKKFLTLINFDEEKIKRLEHQEYALRFFALFELKDTLSGNLKLVLDNYVKNSVTKDRDYDDLLTVFDEVINIITTNNINFKWYRNYKGKKQEMSFSSSYFDAIMIGFATNLDYYKSNSINAKKVVEALKNDETFKKTAMGSFASNEDRLKKRVNQAINFFTPTNG